MTPTMKSEKLARGLNWKHITCLAFAVALATAVLFKPLSQWINAVPPQCAPDLYLTEEQLGVLFNNFNADVSASAPNAWVFTHLVNSVRELYIPQILKLQQKIIEQHRNHSDVLQEQRLVELMNKYESRSTERHEQLLPESTERHEQRLSELMKQYESQSRKSTEEQLSELMMRYESQSRKRTEEQLSELMMWYESQSRKRTEEQLSELMMRYESQSATRTEQQRPGKGAVKAEPMPANTVTLYVGAALNPRRDMVGWGRQGRRSWTNRLDFKVFKFSEIGTIKITIGENSGGKPHRAYAFKNIGALPWGWKERLHFYAFETKRPNTEMISIGRARDPERCIFVRGDHASKLSGWEEHFVFWVPL